MASSAYQKAGVDIDKAQAFLQRIKPLVRKTDRPGVLSTLGHYAGLFAVDWRKYADPILVASTDGVGTKLKLALEFGDLSGLGQDLVAMSANDILCLGAEPLFFLDYLATGRLDLRTATSLLQGISDACREIGCSLLGGETAQMPAVYRREEFDLAGFMVGIVDREKIVDGSKIAVGQKMIGLASSGPHSNGFSLIRKILGKRRSLRKRYRPLSDPLGKVLLRPTRLYGNTVLPLLKRYAISGIAHITGGGLLENIPRILPDRCRAVLRKENWPRPAVFRLIQEWGRVEEREMLRVFNCGIGLVLVVAASDVDPILKDLPRSNDQKEAAWLIGEIVERREGESPIEIL